MPKKQTASRTRAARHDPLGAQIQADEQVTYKAPKKYSKRQQQKEKGHATSDGFVDSTMSAKILAEVKAQQDEIAAEERARARAAAAGSGMVVAGADSSDEDSDAGYDGARDDEEEKWVRMEDLDVVGASAEDEAAIRFFMSEAPQQRQSLGDMIMSQIQANKAKKGITEEEEENKVDPRLVEVYTEVGKFLKRYKSGALPKVVKILPGLSNWDEMLFLTDPDGWSNHAVRAITRIFASNLNHRMAQRFFNLILLPRVVQDINENKALNYHLYEALRKALYKPAAFYKGVLLPLCEDGRCTLRQATIIGSVLVKKRVPVEHSAACLMKLASLPYTGATSVFLKVLLNKRYALPNRIVDHVVDHFMQMVRVPGPLPVVWHQALLVFAQRYKGAVTREQRELLRALMKKHTHHLITSEVRRELFSGPARGEKAAPKPAANGIAAGGAGAGAGASDLAAPTRPRVFVWNRAADSGFKNAPVGVGVASAVDHVKLVPDEIDMSMS